MLSAPISCSSSGDNQIIAGVTGRRIRVCGYVLSGGGNVAAKWRSATTDKTGLLNVSVVNPFTVGMPSLGGIGEPFGWFDCATGEALNLNLSGAVAVGGHVLYELVP